MKIYDDPMLSWTSLSGIQSLGYYSALSFERCYEPAFFIFPLFVISKATVPFLSPVPSTHFVLTSKNLVQHCFSSG